MIETMSFLYFLFLAKKKKKKRCRKHSSVAARALTRPRTRPSRLKAALAFGHEGRRIS